MQSETIEIVKERAVELFGSQTALANALNITKSAVSQWPEGRKIPENHALRIRYVLKPDAFEPSNNI